MKKVVYHTFIFFQQNLKYRFSILEVQYIFSLFVSAFFFNLNKKITKIMDFNKSALILNKDSIVITLSMKS